MVDIRSLKRLLGRMARGRRGNVAILAAACLPVVIGSLALGVDWGYLGYQRRAAQADTDLAALSAASNLPQTPEMLRHYVRENGLDLAVMDEDAYRGLAEKAKPANGVLTYVTGRYTPAAGIGHADRFAAVHGPANAVRVTMHKTAELAFASLFTPPPGLTTQAVAGAEGMAALSIGSRLASLNDGILNAVLGGLLGTHLDFKVMDYRALVDADVDVLKFLDAAAVDLDLTGVTYDEILQSRVSVGRLLAILADTHDISSVVRGLLETAAKAADGNTRTLPLASLFDLGDLARLGPGGEGALSARAGVLDLVSAAAVVAGGDHQIALDLGAAVPGLVNLQVALAVGEPPRKTPWFTVGGQGTLVRTAQTRLRLVASLGGSGLLSGLTIRLPLYLELAFAEGEISKIACVGTATHAARVDVSARPGVAEAWIGAIPDGDISRFSLSGARAVEAATLLDANLRLLPLVTVRATVKGKAHVEIANPRPQTLHFTARDIREGRVRSVSTGSYLAPLASSLIGDLKLSVDLRPLGIKLHLGLGKLALVQHAVASVLSSVARPLDAAVYNLLAALGVRVGEADLRVTAASCGRPVLVQ